MILFQVLSKRLNAIISPCIEGRLGFRCRTVLLRRKESSRRSNPAAERPAGVVFPADKAKARSWQATGFSSRLDEGFEMYGILSSCSMIIHQTINAENVFVYVDGSRGNYLGGKTADVVTAA